MIAPARVAAFEVLRAVFTGRVDLGTALAQARSTAQRRSRPRAGRRDCDRHAALAGAFDHVIGAFANRSLRKLDPEVLDILRLTMFQLLYLDRIPASAAVKDAVDLTGKAGKRSASGLVNAVLRRVSRERERLPFPARPENATQRDAAVAYLSTAFAPCLARVALDGPLRLRGSRGPGAVQQRASGVDLRANPFKTTRDALARASRPASRNDTRRARTRCPCRPRR